jgi:hypothetical protein
MSDLQLVTGFTILINGYTQLPCGLSTYHWQVLVYLAWFSTLTHLSCLTFLRSYLHEHPGERAARLVAMLFLVILLAVSMVPTGAFDWPYDDSPIPLVSPANSTICYFHFPEQTASTAFASMIFSLLLLLFGFAIRVVKSSEKTSTFITEKGKWLSNFFQSHALAKIYNRCSVQKEPWKIRCTLVYRPLLAIFLTLQALADSWNSMFFEVRD